MSCFKPSLEETLARARRYRAQELAVLGVTPQELRKKADDLLCEVQAEVAREEEMDARILNLKLPDVPRPGASRGCP